MRGGGRQLSTCRCTSTESAVAAAVPSAPALQTLAAGPARAAPVAAASAGSGTGRAPLPAVLRPPCAGDRDSGPPPARPAADRSSPLHHWTTVARDWPTGTTPAVQ